MDTAQTEKLKALALAATQGEWQVITDEHSTYAEAYTHKERRIFTRDANPQLGSIYPVVNSSRGIAEKKGDPAIWMVSIEQANADYIAAVCPATVLDLIADNERLRARFEYIEDHATTNGGGNGFTITCFVPVDHEDIGCGIDAAIAAHTSAGEAQA